MVAVPPLVPNVNVLVISAAAVNPPVPVYVKLVAVAISMLVAPTVVVDSTILLVPKLIPRVLLLLELNVPIVKLPPVKFNVPCTSVNTDVALNVCVPSSVRVPDATFNPIPANTLLYCAVHVCVLVNLGVNDVYVPLVDKVNVLTYTSPDTAHELPVKFKVFK